MNNLIKKSNTPTPPLGGKKSHGICPEALPSGWVYTSFSGMSRNPQRKRLKAFDMPNPTATPRASKSPFGGFRGLGWGLVLLLFCLFFSQKTNAQMVGTPYPTPKGCTNVATEGQDFWVSFGNNEYMITNQVYLALQLNNGNSSPVTVTLTFTATGQSANYIIPANTSQQVDFSLVTPAGGTTGANLGDMRQYIYLDNNSVNSPLNPNPNPGASNTLHITCPAVISVIAFNTYQATTDATILLPTNIWGGGLLQFIVSSIAGY